MLAKDPDFYIFGVFFIYLPFELVHAVECFNVDFSNLFH